MTSQVNSFVTELEVLLSAAVYSSIGVNLAGLLGAHGERRRWVGAEWDWVWGGVSPLQPTRESGGAS